MGTWCRSGDLNPDPHKVDCALNAARLPVPPLRHAVEVGSHLRYGKDVCQESAITTSSTQSGESCICSLSPLGRGLG